MKLDPTRRRIRRAALFPALVAALGFPAAAQAATFTVDSVGDARDETRGDGVCSTADGSCTLRAAIETANGDAAHDTILFSLPAGSEIDVAQALPQITAPVEIDGGGSVTLDGGALPADTAAPPATGFSIRPPHGLSVRGTTGSTIRGLTIHSFPGAQIHLAEATAATVAGNRLGTDASGTASLGRPTPGPVDSAGIFAHATTVTRIGGDGADGNVVAATERGMLVDGLSRDVEVAGNTVGLSANGSALPNHHEGIAVIAGGDGTRPRDVTVAGNAIAAAGQSEEPVGGNGIRFQGDQLRALDNTIGYSRTGAVTDPATGRSLGAAGQGIRIHDSQGIEVRRNRIAGSSGHAIFAEEGTLAQLTFTGNRFGLSLDGARTEDADGEPTANHGAGIWLQGSAEDPVIGGDGDDDGNVFAGGRAGIVLEGGAKRPRVVGNVVGFTAGARAAAPPEVAGVVAQEDGTPGGAPVNGRFAGNRIAGVPGATALLLRSGGGHVVERNVVGIDGDGDPAPGHAGIVAVGSADLTIGGSADEGRGNRVAAMEVAGIGISGDVGAQTSVAGNLLGFDEEGRARAGFANDVGVYLYEDDQRSSSPHDVTIGGATPAHGNTIGGGSANVFVAGAEVAGTEIVGNRLGLTPAGEPAGAHYGVYVQGAPSTRVGRPGRGNVIASALFDGVRVLGARPGRRVQGNAIGLGPAPSGASRANGETGVTVVDGEEVVVGIDAGAPHGSCDAAGACNRFGPSGRAGVVVRGSASAVVVRGNDFAHPQAPDWLPVDVGGDGPSALDARDRDRGPNGRLNQPTGVQGGVDRRDGSHWVTGLVESAVPDAVSVDLYAQEGDGALGADATFLGTVRPDLRGRFELRVGPPTDSTRYTALAHTVEGTSEFSRSCGARNRALGRDGDDDGICDEWEALGVDYSQDGRADLTLPYAVVGRRNLYVELDPMSDEVSAVDPRPDVSALRAVEEAFRTSPAEVELTWMGESGSAFGERLPASDMTQVRPGPGAADDVFDFRYGSPQNPCDGWFGSELDRRASDCFARIGARELTVRHVVAVNRLADGDLPRRERGRAFGQRLAVLATGGFGSHELRAEAAGHPQCGTLEGCQTATVSYALMHELGHMLGLRHGGRENWPAYNPAHLSVMSYAYAHAGALNPLDFAHDAGVRFDEGAVDENDPFDLTPAQGGWQPRLTAMRWEGFDGECTFVNATDGQPIRLDDRRSHEVIRHGVNDLGVDCLRPPAHRLEQLEGYEEWSRLTLSPNVPTQQGATLDGDEEEGEPEPPAPDAARNDADDDGFPATTDVCPGRADPGQADANGDGIGDACVDDYDPSDLELSMSGPRRLSPDRTAELTVRVTEAWPFATPSATVAVTLPPGVEPAGPASGDGSFDAATGRWSTGAFAPHETRTLTLPVRAAGGTAETGGELIAEVAEAAERDTDSTPGNGDRDEDDVAARTVAVLSGGSDPQVDVDDARVVEGSGDTRRALSFRVRLSEPSPVRTTFRATVSPGSATPGSDYAPYDREVSVAAWEQTAVVTVPVEPDDVAEPDETVTLRLSRLDGLHAGRLTATGTIADDDRPLGPGDLAPFGCAAPPDAYDRCGVDAAGLGKGVDDAALVGGRHLFVASDGAIALLRRDPSGERLAAAGCVVLASRGTSSERPECARLPKVTLPSGGEGDAFSAVVLDRLLASPAGDRLYVLASSTNSGGGSAVASFAVDAATGALAFERCVGTSGVGSACTSRSGMPSAGASALALAPGGGSLYVAGNGSLAIVPLDAEGRVTSTVRCADTREPSSRCLGLLEADRTTTALAFAPGGERAATVAAGVVSTVARDPANGELAPLARTELTGAARVAWAPDGETLYVGDAVRGAIHLLDAETLAVEGCIGGGELGCAAAPAADLTGIGALHLSADGHDLYAALPGGGVAVFRRAADGTLSGGRCAPAPAGVGPCGDGTGTVQAAPPAWSALVVDPSESVIWAGGGNALSRWLRITRPTGGNRAPLCSEGTTGTRPGRAVALRLVCADPDGDPVTVRITEQPANGTVDRLDASAGTARYTPVERVRGDDLLRFRGSDGTAESADAELRLPVANRAPVCSGTSATARVRRTVQLSWSCTDPDGDPVAVEPVSGPERGSLDGRAYTAPGGWSGTETITLRGSDGFDHSEPFTAKVTVVRPELSCPALTTPLLAYQRQTVERPIACTDADGGRVSVTIAGQSGFLGFAETDGELLRYRARSIVGGELLTLHVADSYGEVYERELQVGVLLGPPPTHATKGTR